MRPGYSEARLQCGQVTVSPGYSVARLQCGQVTVWPGYSVARLQCCQVTVWPGYSVASPLAQIEACTVACPDVSCAAWLVLTSAVNRGFS